MGKFDPESPMMWIVLVVLCYFMVSLLVSVATETVRYKASQTDTLYGS